MVISLPGTKNGHRMRKTSEDGKKANTGRFIVSGVYVERHISMFSKAVDEDAADKREPFKNGN